MEEVNDSVDGQLRLFVYNLQTDAVRCVTVNPVTGWGGDGLLGCNIGQGYLHRLPHSCRGTDGVTLGALSAELAARLPEVAHDGPAAPPLPHAPPIAATVPVSAQPLPPQARATPPAAAPVEGRGRLALAEGEPEDSTIVGGDGREHADEEGHSHV